MSLRVIFVAGALCASANFAVFASAQEEQSDQIPEALVGETLPGAFFMKPEGEGPFPAIILLGGSEGGDRGARSLAPRFLAEGYAVLGVPYYSPAWGGQPQQFPDLPSAFVNIPVDKAGVAKDWLSARGAGFARRARRCLPCELDAAL